MRHSGLGAAMAAAAIALLPQSGFAQTNAAASNPATQALIRQTIEVYIAQQRADQQAVQDRLIANSASRLLDDPATPVIGSKDADVAIIEFFDYTCPFCKAAEPRIEKLLADDKRVKLVVKEFPILTPQSVVAAKASLASMKQGKYTQFHQAMMMFRGQLQADTVFEIAKEIGLDVERLRKDMLAPEIADAIIANFNLARALRINGTPAFIVDGHLLTGNSTQIDFAKVVAAARAK